MGCMLISCMRTHSECTNHHKQKVQLVSYYVAKHSKFYFKDVVTNEVYCASNLGGRRKPTIELGTIIEVEFCGSHILLNEQYIQYAGGEPTGLHSLK